MKTQIAFSHQLNQGKYAALQEQARRLGVIRSEVWQRFGSIYTATVGQGSQTTAKNTIATTVARINFVMRRDSPIQLDLKSAAIFTGTETYYLNSPVAAEGAGGCWRQTEADGETEAARRSIAGNQQA